LEYFTDRLQPPLLQQTIPQHFAGVVAQYGDRTAVICRAQGQRLTYEELNLKSDAVARGLQGLGVQKGERVAVSLGNGIEYAITTYALFKLGAILVSSSICFPPSR
jgi:acyl-CoA synthetase (AMP-forming)/AMP-acid ligase II